MKSARFRFQKLLGILALVICLLVSSLGLSACSSAGGSAGAQNEVLTETQSPTEAESLSEPQGPTEAESLAEETSGPEISEDSLSVEEDGSYSDRDHVALYIHTYGHLPDNFIRKNDARDLGWESSRGNLWDVAPGMSIGGDRFGNREGNLPDVKGRKYYECDINYEGGYRGGERIVYSNDGDVYYSEDHYANFELLYTKDGKAE